MNTRSGVKLLLVLTLGLPLLQTLLTWVAGLLTAMDDASAASVIGRIASTLGIAWLACLTGLIMLLAVRSLEDDRPS